MIGEALTSIKNFLGGERCSLYETDNPTTEVVFDAVESENWSLSATVSKHSVEKGKDISDNHVKTSPETIQLKATMTNHTGISMLNPVSLGRIRPLGVEDVITKQLDRLKMWAETGTWLTYSGAIREPVGSFVVTSFSPSKSSGSGDAVDVSLSLQRVESADELESAGAGLGLLKSVTKKGLANTAMVTASVSAASYKILMGK